MKQTTSAPRPTRVAAMLRDPHFWVPVAVLVAGLLVLGWIT
ncbi:MAG: translocated intimin receptor Tir [Gemmatimonadetes bacterium]|nr:translocated intimin receptor Tir [Gemmatimonadota bacterium]